MNSFNYLALFSMPGGTEWLIIGIIALLLFGKRLPDVARSFGKSIVEFKRGIRDVKENIEHDSNSSEPDQRLRKLASGPAPTNPSLPSDPGGKTGTADHS